MLFGLHSSSVATFREVEISRCRDLRFDSPMLQYVSKVFMFLKVALWFIVT